MWQGFGMCWPVPPHSGQGWLIEKKPWPWESMPRPWQRGQVSVLVPGSAPDPEQVGQVSDFGHRDRDLGPGHRVVEGDPHVGLEVAAAHRVIARPTTAAVEDRREDVADVAGEATALTAERPGSALLAAAEQATTAVVGLALLGVREHVVGLLDFLEALLGFGVTGVAVRVVLAHQFAVRLLDLVGRRLLRDAECFVEVLCHCSRLSPTG